MSIEEVIEMKTWEKQVSICDNSEWSPREKVERLSMCLGEGVLVPALLRAYRRNYGECQIQKFPDRIGFEEFEFIAEKHYRENITEWYDSTIEWKRMVADLRQLIIFNG